MLQNTFLHQPTTINLPGLRPYRPEALTQQPSGASPLQAGGPHPAEALYFERGDYPPDQRLILQAESFFADPAQSLAAVCAFLGLPAHDFAPPRADNPTGRGKERPEHFDALKAAFAERGELRAKGRERRAEGGGQRASIPVHAPSKLPSPPSNLRGKFATPLDPARRTRPVATEPRLRIPVFR